MVKVLGSACGLGVAGSGWVAAPGWWSRTRTSSPVSTTRTVLLGGREPGRRGAGGVLRPAQRHRDPARAGPRRARRSPLAGDARVRHLGGDPRLPAQRAVRRPARAASATTRRVRSSDAYGRGPVDALDDRAARARPARATRAGRWSTGTGRVVTTVFAATTRGPRGGYGVPNAIVRARAAGRGRARSRPVPARADGRRGRPSRYPRGGHGQDARHRREAVRRAATSRACSRARSRSTRATSSPTTTS